MPFVSQAQRAKFHAMAARGELSQAIVDEWEAHTPKGKKLPRRVGPRRLKQAAPQKRRRPIPPSLPWWLLPLAGTSAAGLSAAQTLGSDDHFRRLRQAIDEGQQPLGPYDTAATQYQSMMSRAADTAPGGIPAGELLARVRSSPWLMENVVGIKGYNADTPGSFQEARVHYDQFRKGPIPAYLHQLLAKGRGTPVSPDLATGDVKTYDQLIRPHFDKAYADWRQFHGHKGGYLEGASWLEPYELDQQLVPHEEQLAFMRQFHGNLPPAVQAERQRVETEQWGPGLQNNKRNYEPLASAGLNMRDSLKNMGIAAGGAAAGGALGHYLYRRTAGDDAEPGWGHTAATLGGAGLGGLLGYLGGTEPGRAAVGQAVGAARAALFPGMPAIKKGSAPWYSKYWDSVTKRNQAPINPWNSGPVNIHGIHGAQGPLQLDLWQHNLPATLREMEPLLMEEGIPIDALRPHQDQKLLDEFNRQPDLLHPQRLPPRGGLMPSNFPKPPPTSGTPSTPAPTVAAMQKSGFDAMTDLSQLIQHGLGRYDAQLQQNAAPLVHDPRQPGRPYQGPLLPGEESLQRVVPELRKNLPAHDLIRNQPPNYAGTPSLARPPMFGQPTQPAAVAAPAAAPPPMLRPPTRPTPATQQPSWMRPGGAAGPAPAAPMYKAPAATTPKPPASTNQFGMPKNPISGPLSDGATGLYSAGMGKARAMSKTAGASPQESEAPRKKEQLGPWQHAYVADSVGAEAIRRSSAILSRMHAARKPETPIFDTWITMQGGLGEALAERMSRGAKRLATNTKLRWLSQLDPTRDGRTEGLVGALTGLAGPVAPDVEQRVADAYREHLRKHQAPQSDPDAAVSARQTPWHVNLQGVLADRDADIAGHTYMRRERPLHYWLNPFGSAGPVTELADRYVRRAVAGAAEPEDTSSRFWRGLLPFVGAYHGGQAAQDKLRRAAAQNAIYPAEAEPPILLRSKAAASAPLAGPLTPELAASDQLGGVKIAADLFQGPLTAGDAQRVNKTPSAAPRIRGGLQERDVGDMRPPNLVNPTLPKHQPPAIGSPKSVAVPPKPKSWENFLGVWGSNPPVDALPNYRDGAPHAGPAPVKNVPAGSESVIRRRPFIPPVYGPVIPPQQTFPEETRGPLRLNMPEYMRDQPTPAPPGGPSRARLLTQPPPAPTRRPLTPDELSFSADTATPGAFAAKQAATLKMQHSASLGGSTAKLASSLLQQGPLTPEVAGSVASHAAPELAESRFRQALPLHDAGSRYLPNFLRPELPPASQLAQNYDWQHDRRRMMQDTPAPQPATPLAQPPVTTASGIDQDVQTQLSKSGPRSTPAWWQYGMDNYGPAVMYGVPTAAALMGLSMLGRSDDEDE